MSAVLAIRGDPAARYALACVIQWAKEVWRAAHDKDGDGRITFDEFWDLVQVPIVQ